MSLLVILGPTAVGKTKLAVALANKLDGEIISADSRQVYKGMDLGTGKDLEDFELDGKQIPFHLIDIKEAGEEYNLFNFQQDFYIAYKDIIKRGKQPILCGGTGMYLEAALDKNALFEVPIDKNFRNSLESESQAELNDRLFKMNSKQHNTTDIEDRERTLRALEIELYKQNNSAKAKKSPVKSAIIFGIDEEREILRDRIANRLRARLDAGMVEEVKGLMNSGISAEKMNYYGLEYRFMSQFIMKEIDEEALFTNLVQAIRKFAKRQMTWFRRMEKRGHQINWISAEISTEDKIKSILEKTKTA